MSDCDDDYYQFTIKNLIDNPVISLPKTIAVAAS